MNTSNEPSPPILTPQDTDRVIELLKAGAIGVVRTDTIYGVVASADDVEAVERIYVVRGRDRSKALITLIAHKSHIFGDIPTYAKAAANAYWPGRVSLILSAPETAEHIHRGLDAIAYRMPDEPWLTEIITAVGPLVAPSANPEGERPANSIPEAIAYFGETVDFYVDGGEVLDPMASKVIRINEDGSEERLR